ncbi:hypothetical protein PROFUN_11184 [Planoprotostelium fungivorum]|uniref:Uncharacterized protein n=1 Tax=Planoprotostelium fungivorum TaxID=1890364 RepID=A0A2P6NAT6_9EUKA|nr:hypothetical protein PROFUN_11184 [Planoprotostelium fungivorum]
MESCILVAKDREVRLSNGCNEISRTVDRPLHDVNHMKIQETQRLSVDSKGIQWSTVQWTIANDYLRASQGTLISESQQEPKLGERMVSGMFEARDEEKTCIVKSALAVTLTRQSTHVTVSPDGACPNFGAKIYKMPILLAFLVAWH